MKTQRYLLSVAAAAASLAMSSTALAQATAQLNVKITIASACDITSTTDLTFGSVLSTAGNQSANTGEVQVKCTPQTSYKLGLQSTASGSANDGTGTMKNSIPAITQTIGYQLYQGGYTTIWGNDVAGTNTVSGTGDGLVQTYAVYGKTTSTLNVPAGDYSDTVQVQVYY